MEKYRKAKDFLRRQGGEFIQENIVREIYENSDDKRYIKNLLNEAFNEKKILGYKYTELCRNFGITPEFPEMARQNWLEF